MVDEFGGMMRQINDPRAGIHSILIRSDMLEMFTSASTFFEGAAYAKEAPLTMWPAPGRLWAGRAVVTALFSAVGSVIPFGFGDYHRLTEPFARITQLTNRRSQYHMHLLSFAPPPGLAHLPMQFAALFSHRGASAFAGELRSDPMPIKVITKNRFRAMCEPPETGSLDWQVLVLRNRGSWGK
jgi:hypothetical protein